LILKILINFFKKIVAFNVIITNQITRTSKYVYHIIMILANIKIVQFKKLHNWIKIVLKIVIIIFKYKLAVGLLILLNK